MSWFLVLIVFLLASIKTTNNKKHSVSVVIPAYNEEKTVAENVRIIKKVDYIDEVLVVNDGSTDNTVQEALSADAKVLNHKTNLGKGAAIKTGFKNSKSDIVAFIDADISNLTPKKVDNIIKPILDGKTDITKTKFARESGRVTELTAKPLLKFFFPEVVFEQPLSGQFAGKRTALNKIKFEKDYGVDVGIVLDADVHGIQIQEVDIGDIEHDMSPLSDLNRMANEVVRTIINRAVEYGRVTMMDTLGSYIRMAIMGLSLIILGIFTIFFVQPVPLQLGIIISIIGAIFTIYYVVKIVSKSINILKKGSRGSLLKSFLKMHFPFLICGIILVLMLTTFLGAATINDGVISIEPTSRNLIIFSHSDNQTISVRGPYFIDSAIENETDILRIPSDALATMQIDVGDTIQINHKYYSINATREGEDNTLRMPSDARKSLEANSGDVISNSRLFNLFDSSTVTHKINSSNLTNNTTLEDNFNIYSHQSPQTNVNISLNGKHIKTISGSFKNDSQYTVSFDGKVIGSFNGENVKQNKTLDFYSGNNIIEINFTNPDKDLSCYQFLSSNEDSFLKFYSV